VEAAELMESQPGRLSAKGLKVVMDQLIAEVGDRGWVIPAPTSAEFKAATAIAAE